MTPLNMKVFGLSKIIMAFNAEIYSEEKLHFSYKLKLNIVFGLKDRSESKVYLNEESLKAMLVRN